MAERFGIVGATASIIGLVQSSFTAILLLSTESTKLHAVLSASSGSNSALRFRYLYSDYQAQLRLLLAKLTEHSAPSIAELTQNWNDFRMEEALGANNFVMLRKSVLQIKSKLSRILATVTIDNANHSTNRLKKALAAYGTGKKRKTLEPESREEARVITAIIQATQRTGSFILRDEELNQSQIRWDISEDTLKELLDDIEFAIDPIKNMVRNLQPPLPNFDKVTKVATWQLWTPESETEGVSDYIGDNYTYVSPLSMDDFLDSLPEIAHGKYPREKVPIQNFCPAGEYRGICKIFMKFQHHEPETVGIGTGWLIDHDTVVTAAHNLYSPTEKSHAIDIRIHIGYTQEKTTAHVRSEERRAQAVAVHWGYYATGQPQYDFAIVRLKSPFQKVRAIPFKKTPSVIPSATKLRVLGYPGDLPMDDQQLKGHIMYSSQCRVKAHDLEENGYLIEYLLDTAGGNSGGPVLEVSDDDKFCAIGVHCYGGAINSATTIGHQGNDINGFRKALFETTGGPGVQIKEIQGKVDGLKQITVTKQQ